MARNRDRRHRKWRDEVKDRDKVCQICGGKKRLAAHHLYDWSHYIDKRYDVDNGILLCGRHHNIYHVKFKWGYRARCTVADWNRFIRLIKVIKEDR